MNGKQIELADVFFQVADQRWLTPNSLPKEPIHQWALDHSPLPLPSTVRDPLPLLYWQLERPDKLISLENDKVTVNLDVFGTAFYFLTCYEEAVVTQRDEHGRFLARYSLASRAGYLMRPLVNEYLELLWIYMQYLWPQLSRKQRQFQQLTTCDVDNFYDPSMYSVSRFIRRIGADFYLRRSARQALETAISARRVHRKGRVADPYQTFNWMMTENEKHDNRCVFFFVCGGDTVYEGRYQIDAPEVRALIREIHARGHEIGLHTSYEAASNPNMIAYELNNLRTTMGRENISQPHIGVRQHYLRFEPVSTWRHFSEANLAYDTSLGFADLPGFRAGTCYEFSLFDLLGRMPLRITQRPLILMECTVIGRNYLDLGYSDRAFEIMKTMKDICRDHAGEFVFLWHNSHFNHPQDKDLYSSIISNLV